MCSQKCRMMKLLEKVENYYSKSSEEKKVIIKKEMK
jgi:hypothetical protein